MADGRTRILIADDHTLFREGLTELTSTLGVARQSA